MGKARLDWWNIVFSKLRHEKFHWQFNNSTVQFVEGSPLKDTSHLMLCTKIKVLLIIEKHGIIMHLLLKFKEFKINWMTNCYQITLFTSRSFFKYQQFSNSFIPDIFFFPNVQNAPNVTYKLLRLAGQGRQIW